MNTCRAEPPFRGGKAKVPISHNYCRLTVVRYRHFVGTSNRIRAWQSPAKRELRTILSCT